MGPGLASQILHVVGVSFQVDERLLREREVRMTEADNTHGIKHTSQGFEFPLHTVFLTHKLQERELLGVFLIGGAGVSGWARGHCWGVEVVHGYAHLIFEVYDFRWCALWGAGEDVVCLDGGGEELEL